MFQFFTCTPPSAPCLQLVKIVLQRFFFLLIHFGHAQMIVASLFASVCPHVSLLWVFVATTVTITCNFYYAPKGVFQLYYYKSSSVFNSVQLSSNTVLLTYYSIIYSKISQYSCRHSLKENLTALLYARVVTKLNWQTFPCCFLLLLLFLFDFFFLVFLYFFRLWPILSTYSFNAFNVRTFSTIVVCII